MIVPIAQFGGGLGGGEMILIFLVVLLLFGSKNLPKIARNLGRSMEEFRRAAREVKDEIMTADQNPTPPPAPPKELSSGNGDGNRDHERDANG